MRFNLPLLVSEHQTTQHISEYVKVNGAVSLSYSLANVYEFSDFFLVLNLHFEFKTSNIANKTNIFSILSRHSIFFLWTC